MSRLVLIFVEQVFLIFVPCQAIVEPRMWLCVVLVQLDYLVSRNLAGEHLLLIHVYLRWHFEYLLCKQAAIFLCFYQVLHIKL